MELGYLIKKYAKVFSQKINWPFIKKRVSSLYINNGVARVGPRVPGHPQLTLRHPQHSSLIARVVSII